MAIRVILADNQEIMREGLRILIERQSDIKVVGEAENGKMAVKLVQELSPDVIIMGISMPNMNGIEATYQITKEFKDTKVIILSMYATKHYILKAFQAGALSYLLKTGSFIEIIHAIKAVINNETYITPSIASIIFDEFFHNVSNIKYLKSLFLTARECEVLQMLAEGKPTLEIAKCLKVSVKTIESHRKNIMDKLDIHSVAELTKYAIRHGLTTLDV